MATFLERLAPLVVSDTCQIDFWHMECAGQVATKLIGATIFVITLLIKLPQIVKILSAKSGEGISKMAMLLELISCTSLAFYCFQNKYPLSGYVEIVSNSIQTAIVGVLILHYGKQELQAATLAVVYSLAIFLLVKGYLPENLLLAFQITNIPFNMFGKCVQALKNYRNGHTGQLSAATFCVLLPISVVRILTYIQETGDILLITPAILNSFFYLIIVFQMVYYWKSTQLFLLEEKKCKKI